MSLDKVRLFVKKSQEYNKIHKDPLIEERQGLSKVLMGISEPFSKVCNVSMEPFKLMSEYCIYTPSQLHSFYSSNDDSKFNLFFGIKEEITDELKDLIKNKIAEINAVKPYRG